MDEVPEELKDEVPEGRMDLDTLLARLKAGKPLIRRHKEPSLDHHLQYMDDKVAQQILSISKNKVDTYYKGKTGVKFKGHEERNHLIAQIVKPDPFFGCDQSGRTISLERCAAVSAHFVLKKLINYEDGGSDFGISELPKVNGVDITNSSADRIGFPKDTVLYYVYNRGIGLMLDKYPVISFAVLLWKEKHKEKIFSGGGTKEIDKDCLASRSYLEKIGKKTDQAPSVVAKELTNKAEEIGVTEYLDKLQPRMRYGEHSRSN